MRAVVRTTPGVVEVNFMWLPTWIGMNSTIKKEVEQKLKSLIEGMPITPESLDQMHEMVVDELVALNPSVEGLRSYLDAMRHVKIDGTDEG